MKNKILIFPERGTIQEKKEFLKKADGLVKKGKAKYVLTGDLVDNNFGNIKPKTTEGKKDYLLNIEI